MKLATLLLSIVFVSGAAMANPPAAQPANKAQHAEETTTVKKEEKVIKKKKTSEEHKSGEEAPKAE